MSDASFTPGWLAGAPAAHALLARIYTDPAERARVAHQAAQRSVDSGGVHPGVLASISLDSDAQRANHTLLAQPGTVCMVTGQQAGLFGGPLYTVYKAAAAIANARALTAETGVPCVPIFWLQNEDHDYDEIAACAIPGDESVIRVRAPGRDGDADRSIAARRYGPAIDAALDELDGELTGPSAAEVMACLRTCYRPDVSPDTAFRHLMTRLFAPHGLLIVDPMHPAMIAAAEPLHRRALAEAKPIADTLLTRVAALRSAGFKVQIHVRPGAPLSFVHPQGQAGPRYRVEPITGGFRVCGTDRTLSAEAVDAGPFSTSALLRPILQDTLLPTVGYVGGPGEVAYFAQLPPLYAHFDLPMPMIILRARVRVIDPKSERLLRQLDLTADDLAKPQDALMAHLGSASEGRLPPADLEAALLEPLQAVFAQFAPHAAFDKGLRKATHKTQRTLVDVSQRLVDRYRRTLGRTDEVALRRLRRVMVRLQPEGAPQERVHCWPGAAAQYGIDEFVEQVMAAVVPFEGDLKDVRI